MNSDFQQFVRRVSEFWEKEYRYVALERRLSDSFGSVAFVLSRHIYFSCVPFHSSSRVLFESSTLLIKTSSVGFSCLVDEFPVCPVCILVWACSCALYVENF